ncbi:hypothetical protein [Sorangium sp. So ce513]|uniref:hypothetical protein n=1 Tax=Sorangium sp. So ce513 TaxID=3133315 RepID=UPI003F60A880
MTRRRAIVWGAAAVALVALVLIAFKLGRFPPDTTPEGAYLRIAYNLGASDTRACFPYLEDRAQHAAYTIRDYRRKAFERIEASYPEPERARLLDQYRAHAMAEDGADVWVDLAAKQGFVARLRRDLSGIGKVEVTGERATVETARGTRYPFRRRENGIWGLTLFTAELVAEAERAARDWDVVEKAALDYERAR